MQAHIHFRSVFDVSPADPIEKPWVALIGEVRAWIARKEKDPLQGFFFKGGTWSGPPPLRARVESRTLSDGSTTPEMWAVCYEHGDSAIVSRRWTTNIGVTATGTNRWRLAVELRHWLRPGYVGPEPPAPEPSSPRLITGLLSSKNWIATIGSIRLSAAPVTLGLGKGHEFAALLRDPGRQVPIVLVSCERKTGVPKLDSVNLARALAGTALVYLCESPECDDELEHFIPDRFRSPNGMTRIYAPGVDFDKEWTSARHRFFRGREIEEQGDDVITGHVVRALTRSDAWRGLQASVSSIEDIEARVREQRLTELRTASSRSSRETDELLSLFMTDNDKLSADNSQLQEQHDADLEKLEQFRSDLARRDYELEQVRLSAGEARKETLEYRDALQAVLNLEEWPDDVLSVAKLAEQLSAGRVVFTTDALKSLEKSDFASSAESRSIIWQCVRAMATHLYEMVTDGDGRPAQHIADAFKVNTASRFELSWTESKPTKRDTRLTNLRKIVHEGVEMDITPHIKWGSKPPRILRVHFCVDHDRKRLVIGHCGNHLDTYGTRRRS